MIQHLLRLYASVVDRVAVVVAPAAVGALSAVLAEHSVPASVLVQQTPTGMLDAIMLACDDVRARRPRRVLITWCDQVAISPDTVSRVVAASGLEPEPSLVLPTCRQRDPYVHLDRDPQGRITRVLHRREGDAMPPEGESDAGVFDLSVRAYLESLPQYAREPEIGARTGERNFVPFVAWMARQGGVVTVPCADPEEAVGINTPDELALVEAHLRARPTR
jgi:bifunctional UDP-N-acetylglucosamine pyrophosphorylase / glucosamine-1-phosphate N-acetyltransferase